MKQIDAAIGIVVRTGKILICQRRAGDFYGGFWEFPGGKCEPGETPEQCLHRELQEEIAIKVNCRQALTQIEHDYPGKRVRLHPYLCDHVEGEPQLLQCQAVQWIDVQDLPNHAFPPANEPLIKEVMQILSAVIKP
jgi:mutator protein MutT